jgi:hypothetical protein
MAGLLNVLRLFFGQLSNALATLLGPNGGRYLGVPNGLFFHTGSQTLAATNTGYPVQFNTTYLSSDVSVASGSRLTVAHSGVYNFQYRGCAESGSASAKQVLLWIVRNGTAIGYSTTPYTLSGNGTFGEINWSFNIDLQAGGYIELYWAADSTDVTLTTEAAAAPHPGIPASVCAVRFVAPLPAVLPTPP